MNFNYGQMVWTIEGLYQYIGMDEDGAIHCVRPVKSSAFNLIEFHEVYPVDDDDYDEFLKLNGETLSMKYKRKGLPLPEKSRNVMYEDIEGKE